MVMYLIVTNIKSLSAKSGSKRIRKVQLMICYHKAMRNLVLRLNWSGL